MTCTCGNAHRRSARGLASMLSTKELSGARRHAKVSAAREGAATARVTSCAIHPQPVAVNRTARPDAVRKTDVTLQAEVAAGCGIPRHSYDHIPALL